MSNDAHDDGHDHDHGHHHGHHHGHGHGDSHRHGAGTGHKFDISRLERLRDPERLETMNPDKIWAALAPESRRLAGDLAVIDLGVGIGFFAIPFARKIPGGTVYGCDLSAEMLTYLKAAIEQEGVSNIVPVQTAEVEVPLEDGIGDALLMVNLHHELDYRDRTLTECRRLLRDGGRIAIVDWKPIETEHGPPVQVRIPEPQVQAELEAAGFSAVVRHEVLPNHYLLTATK